MKIDRRVTKLQPLNALPQYNLVILIPSSDIRGEVVYSMKYGFDHDNNRHYASKSISYDKKDEHHSYHSHHPYHYPDYRPYQYGYGYYPNGYYGNSYARRPFFRSQFQRYGPMPFYGNQFYGRYNLY